MKLHRMCSMSGKSHQSNGSSELSPSILLRGRSRGEDASDCGRQRLVSGGGLEAKCPTDSGFITLSPITNGSPSHGQPGGAALLQGSHWCVCLCSMCVEGRMIIRKTLPSAGQKTTSPHVGNECFTGRGPSSRMFEIWHVLCEHWMTSRILSNDFHLWRNNLLCKWLHI